MRTMLECLEMATHCERKAGDCLRTPERKVYRDIAEQWRVLARVATEIRPELAQNAESRR
ncbi:MAG: hypothetical protein JOY81_05305 [Alphaproteobacteria bacterium]|nr:hypothetical protein [Alphaproteobacteria bacterium]